MMKDVRILDIGINFGNPVAEIFAPWNPTFLRARYIEDIKQMIPDVDLVCFGGGQDVAPSVYGHRNVASATSQEPTARDRFEIEVWKLCQKHQTPILGVCRGSQFACAMSGGFLLQDVVGHAHGPYHMIETADGPYEMTTTHHQMQYPYLIPHELLAWITVDDVADRRYTFDQKKLKALEFPFKEPEIVYYPETRALAVQGHPEYFEVNHKTTKWVRGLVRKYLLGGSNA